MKVLIGLCLIAVVFARQVLAHVCGANEEYTKCGAACPLTCDNYQNPPQDCTKQCDFACQCIKEYVKTAGGRCVLPGECPTRGKVCGEHQRYNSCGTACPLTCENYQNPPKVCNLPCVTGCGCVEGYVRTAVGECVLPGECLSRTLTTS